MEDKPGASCRSLAGLSLLLSYSVFHTDGISLSPSLLHVRKIVDLLSISWQAEITYENLVPVGCSLLSSLC